MVVTRTATCPVLVWEISSQESARRGPGRRRSLTFEHLCSTVCEALCLLLALRSRWNRNTNLSHTRLALTET